jgi:hypothetical protein
MGRAELRPAATLHAKSCVSPNRPQPINGLEHGAPCPLEQVIALEDECNGDALTGAEHAKGRFVGGDHFHLGADLFRGRGDGRLSDFRARSPFTADRMALSVSWRYNVSVENNHRHGGAWHLVVAFAEWLFALIRYMNATDERGNKVVRQK